MALVQTFSLSRLLHSAVKSGHTTSLHSFYSSARSLSFKQASLCTKGNLLHSNKNSLLNFTSGAFRNAEDPICRHSWSSLVRFFSNAANVRSYQINFISDFTQHKQYKFSSCTHSFCSPSWSSSSIYNRIIKASYGSLSTTQFTLKQKQACGKHSTVINSRRNLTDKTLKQHHDQQLQQQQQHGESHDSSSNNSNTAEKVSSITAGTIAAAAPSSVSDAVLYWSSVLDAAEVPEAELSAEHIIAKVLNTSRAALLSSLESAEQQEQLTDDQQQQLDTFMTCRLQRMPVQYIVGDWDFHSITLDVWPPVFIPRPETEQLVELTLDLLQQEHIPGDGESCARVLELCCGSGAISLALLANNKQVECVGVEQSGSAVALAAHNASKLGLLDRLTLVHSKVEAEKPLQLPHSTYSIIVANPPYIFNSDIRRLAPEILLYEDVRALDGGKQGLDLIKVIVQQAGSLLMPRGHLLLEVDPRHGKLMQEWLQGSDAADEAKVMQLIRTVKDFAGKERFLHFVKR
uniref:peptide chain release factor N(5)-glutamine methyltransferase n=1 Tax=Hirondellea gigas TaxID=1518452 RepID=A0A2P2I4F3_9CRUS